MTRWSLLILTMGLVDGTSAQDSMREPVNTESRAPTIEVQLEGRALVFSPDPTPCGVDSATVLVTIRVDRQGIVQSAVSYQSSNYMPMPCATEAVEHARKLRFSVSTTAKARQSGTIVYRFGKL
jgi:hypothetical protein